MEIFGSAHETFVKSLPTMNTLCHWICFFFKVCTLSSKYSSALTSTSKRRNFVFQSGNPQPPTIILPPPKDVNLLVPYEHSTFSFNSCSCFCKLKLDSFQNMTFHHLFVLDCPGRQALSKSFSKPWLHIKSNLSADRMNKRLLGLSAHRFLSTVIKNNFENNWEDLTNFPSTCTQLCYSFGPMHVSSKCGTTLTKR